ncbi:MAG: quinol:cytochrome C oxidoreductase [Myxococcota bacterium]
MDHKPVELDLNDPQFKWDGAPTLMRNAFIVGAVGILAAVGVGATKDDHFAGFFHSYQVAYVYFLAIALGCLFFVTLQHLVRAGWSVTVRRLFEFGAGTMPVMLALSLPVIVPAVLGNDGLYAWVNAETVANDHLIHHKAPYLNIPFFLIRVAIYFGLWIMMARYFVGFSKAQDTSGDWKLTAKAQGHAAPLMIFFGLTLTFAAVDFIMSLEPHWYSTIIGVYYFATSVMSSMAMVILLAKFLQSKGKVKVISTEHYHDLGKLLFAFTFFWAYIAFSQYMLIWYANIPEGTIWYQHRQHGQWVPYSFFLLFGHFFIPFLGLISRNVKRATTFLAFWAGWMLFMHWVDMFYLVMPSLYEHGTGYDQNVLPLSLMDPLCMIGVGGIFVGALAMGIRGSYLVPMKDPRLNESLAFENI